MATHADLERWLDGLIYQPDSRLSLPQPQGRYYFPTRLLVEVMVEDTYNPGRVIRVLHLKALPPAEQIPNEDVFRRVVQQALHEVAMHEVDEWLRDKATGRPVFDPHARDGQT